MEDLTGFALSQEELLVALLLLDLPAPIGFDDLEERVFGRLSEDVRSPLMAATERALVARGLLAIEAEGSQMDADVRSALQTVTRPDDTWIVLHQPTGEPQTTSYFHQREADLVAHVDTWNIHQFVALSGRGKW